MRNMTIVDWRSGFEIRAIPELERREVAGLPVVNRQTPRPTMMDPAETIRLLR